MKTASLLALSLTLGTFAIAQDAQPAPAAAAPTGNELPAVNHLVYLEKLPTPASLMKDAKAQGQTIQRIDRTDDSVIVTYKYADGHTDTTGYTTLAAASTVEEPNVTASTPPAAPATTAGTVTAVQPTTTVVYTQPAPVYYTYGPRYGYYDPVGSFWGPLVLGVGIGWATGWHGGGYHYHGGWHH